MKHWKRALGLGMVSWLAPFLGGFAAFPLKSANAPLFDTAMALIVVVTAALLTRRYFRDVPLTAARYYSEIGAGYLLYLAFLWGNAWVRRPA